MGRVQRHPFVPRAAQEVEVTRRVHLRQQGVVQRVRLLYRSAPATLTQLGQHMVDPLGHLDTRHQLATEHFHATVVQGVEVVVDDGQQR